MVVVVQCIPHFAPRAPKIQWDTEFCRQFFRIKIIRVIHVILTGNNFTAGRTFLLPRN